MERANGDYRLRKGEHAGSAFDRPARGPESRRRRNDLSREDKRREGRSAAVGEVASLNAGDVVLVTKLDRLGRSTRELLDLIEGIGKAGAAFRSLGDPLWDTSSSQGRLLSTLLAAIAEFERDLIRERTGEGRKRAQANGVKFGRKPKLSDFQRKEAIKRRAAGETLAEIAKSYAVDLSMISRLS
jgi:DNA invertase Pin-like site-specific DNA recombinase